MISSRYSECVISIEAKGFGNCMEYNDKFPPLNSTIWYNSQKANIAYNRQIPIWLHINAMTRSIPSIIVLTLMCFTIGYGFVRFPDAGILDAGFSSPADGSAASTDGQMYTAMRQPADGSDLQQNESSASTVEYSKARVVFISLHPVIFSPSI